MKLTIVGCTGSFPGPGSPASCYLLTATDGERNWKIVLDLGSGALGAIQRYTDLEDIDAIFLTHLHPDRFITEGVVLDAASEEGQPKRARRTSTALDRFMRASRSADVTRMRTSQSARM